MNDIALPIYLMPFTAEAVLLHHILENNGITAAGFCDNRESSHGKSYHGCEIMSPARAFERSPGAAVILCMYKHYNSNGQQMRETGFSRIFRLEQMLSESDITAALPMIDSENFLSIAPRQAPRYERLSYDIRHYLLPDNALADDALILNQVSFTITEKCTLKCKNCSDLMQYFSAPADTPASQIFRNIDALMSKVDFVRRVSFVGGETLIHKNLPEMLRYLMNWRKKFGFIQISTNGTIAPSNRVLDALKECGVFLRISNYGKLSVNLERLKLSLDDYSIPYQVNELEWYECQHLQNEINAAAQQTFNRCMGKIECNSVKNERLYYCPFLSHGETLAAFPFDKRNHVCLTDDSTTKEDIKKYLKNDTAPPGCQYCGGRDNTLPRIPVAEQTSKPLSYRSFD